MATNCGILLIALCTVAAGEVVYVDDLNKDHSKRNLDFGLPETINVRLRRSAGDLDLTLVENKRLNANAPIYMADDANTLDNTRVLKQDVRANGKVKFYQAKDLSAYVSVECRRESHGPCVRTLTGNVFVDGAEHKIEPINDYHDKRELDPHLGTAHSLEVLERTPFDTELDYVVPGTEDLSEEERPNAKQRELEILEEKLKALKLTKRTASTPTAHGTELLLAIDHVIYEKFAKRYTGDETILLKIREYYSHVINGVDLRYATIQADDVSFYVTIAAFYISKKASTSPWMDYSGSLTDGSAGLGNMRTWIKGSTIPAHDHAMLITGSDIQAGGRAGVAGIAYLRGVCKGWRVSINEELGFFKGAAVLAHELGHNLGSPHDTHAPGSACTTSDSYIMAPWLPYLSSTSTTVRPWRFSPCSIWAFRSYVKSLGATSCTLNRAKIYDKDEFNDHTKGLAGQLYSEDEQCELLMGDGATMCASNKNTAGVCRKFQCQSSPSGSCRRFIAAHGTPCRQGMICFEGGCRNDNRSEWTTPVPTPPPHLNYMGTCDKTLSSYTCQRWDAQWPHGHTYTDPAMYPDATLADASNYCRDPSKEGILWCYTTNKDKRWEECSVNKCSAVGHYKGTCYSTATGETCQRWDSQSPHRHGYVHKYQFPDAKLADASNFCRDPSNEGILWCYTTNKDRRWEKCNVNNCKDGLAHYTGLCDSTATGETCQRWDSQSPHNHSYVNKEQFPDATLADASNHCRDPSNNGILWCYTTNKDRRWEKCNVNNCKGPSASTYKGTCKTTASGKTCQRWDSQSPHRHGNNDPSKYPDATLADASNYCRDPDGEGFPWCYTTDKDRRYEKCNVNNCRGNLNTYKGKCSDTASGKTCQRWDSQSPHRHGNNDPSKYPDATLADASNYCRDPDGEGFPWCYTTDKDRRWEKCNVNNCRGNPAMSDTTCYKSVPNTFPNTEITGWELRYSERCISTSFDPEYQRQWSSICTSHADLNTPKYKGKCSDTASGKTCQRWDSQSPHRHGNNDPSKFPDATLADASNYCRDAAGEGFPWCYTTDKDRKYEKCNVNNCRGNLNTTNYKGKCSDTASGKTCQRWDKQSPQSHSNNDPSKFPDATLADASNYCRDPDGEGFPWCYTTDKDRRYEKCNVNNCPGNVKMNPSPFSARAYDLGEMANEEPSARGTSGTSSGTAEQAKAEYGKTSPGKARLGTRDEEKRMHDGINKEKRMHATRDEEKRMLPAEKLPRSKILELLEGLLETD